MHLCRFRGTLLPGASGGTGPLDVSRIRRCAVGVIVSAERTGPTGPGDSPASFTLTAERQGADGTWFPLWTWTPALGAALDAINISIGAGCAVPHSLGRSIRLRWHLDGEERNGATRVLLRLSVAGT